MFRSSSLMARINNLTVLPMCRSSSAPRLSTTYCFNPPSDFQLGVSPTSSSSSSSSSSLSSSPIFFPDAHSPSFMDEMFIGVIMMDVDQKLNDMLNLCANLGRKEYLIAHDVDIANYMINSVRSGSSVEDAWIEVEKEFNIPENSSGLN